MVSDLTRHRRDFWQYFADTLPELNVRMQRGNEHSRWLAVGHRPLVIAHYIANAGVGLFIRGEAGEPTWRVREFLFPHREFLARRLDRPGLKLGNMFLLPNSVRLDMTDRSNWQRATAWFAQNSPVYETVFTDLQSKREGWPDERPPPPDLRSNTR
ncbi:hypothetical protein [Arvimicrobium flavum]|uniref:hypothetical protein n=1 Tax=Arvimicrobium flavum TaxID=3393320 RepID=UPI00237C00EF|nr:hypothetical protein [Mesorhizobium shangrilense]